MDKFICFAITTPGGKTTRYLSSGGVEVLKERARKLKRAEGISHGKALERVALAAGFPNWRSASEANKAAEPFERIVSKGWLVAFENSENDLDAEAAGFVENTIVPFFVEKELLAHCASLPSEDDADGAPWDAASSSQSDDFDDLSSSLTFYVYTGDDLPETLSEANARLSSHTFWGARYMWLKGKLHDPFESEEALCEECGCADPERVIYDDGDPTEDAICARCFRESGRYGECWACESNNANAAHPIGQLNANGECPVHDGEGDFDAEELAGWADIIENRNKDG